MAYGKMHRLFLKTVASQGVLSIIDAQAVLERFNDEGQLLSVTDLVKAINDEIQPYHQEIKITKDDVTNEDVVVFLSLANDAATKAQNIFSSTELEYFRVLMEHIMSTESKQIKGINAMNLVSSMKSNFTKTDARKVLNTWCRMQYFDKVQDNYSLGMRATHELEGYFVQNMPYAMEECFFCKHIVFRGHNCPGCAQAIHTKCLLRYSQRVQKWPCCKIDFEEELLLRLYTEGLPPTQVSDTTRHFEQNNFVAESTQFQEASKMMVKTQEVIPNNSNRANRKRKCSRSSQTQVVTTHPASSGKRSRNKWPTDVSPFKARRGPLNFSAGKRSHAEAHTRRPTPSQQPTSVVEGPATCTMTQQPDSKDKVADKRSHSETLSPREEHKRPRLEQSQRVAERSHAQVTSAMLDVAITCDRTEILSKAVSDQVLAAIQKQIIIEACSPKPDAPGPTFNAKPLFAEGVIKLWCGNDHTLAWLKKTVSGLRFPSTSLVLKSQSEIHKRARCGIVVPDEQGVFQLPTNIGHALSYQNPWVDIKRWKLLRTDKQAAAWFVVVGVPVDQIPTLMEAGRRLSIGLGAVYVKFQNQNGRFTDIPQGWDPTTGTICEALNQLPQAPAGKSSPPSNKLDGSAAEPTAAASAAPAVP